MTWLVQVDPFWWNHFQYFQTPKFQNHQSMFLGFQPEKDWGQEMLATFKADTTLIVRGMLNLEAIPHK